jgi:Lsr2
LAERLLSQLIDDLDGTEIPEGSGEKIEFAIRGVQYRIDLADRNVAKLDKALRPFIASATKVSGRQSNVKQSGRARSTRKSGRSASQLDNAAIRAWASENGYDVSARGRIPANVVTAYQESHEG